MNLKLKNVFILGVILILIGCNKTFVNLNKIEYDRNSLVNSVVFIYVQHDTSVIHRGTGFLIRDDGLLATADHVIYNKSRKDVYSSLYCLRYVGESNEREIFPIRVVKRFRKGTSGKDLAILKIELNDSTTSFPNVEIEDTYEAGDPILVAGFPKVFDSPSKPPLLRSGIISSTQYTVDDSIKVLILDLPTVSGYSGCPVINLKTGKAIAVFKGHPKENKTSDFAIATVISKEDFILYLKDSNLSK